MHWTGWTLERVLILFVGVAFLAVGAQVTLSHYRQNFHHRAMWYPVVSAPVFAVTAAALASVRAEWLLQLFHLFMWAGTFIGAVGFYFHFHGVGIRVGGWTMRNFLVGPPVILPVLFIAISALGLIAVYWR
ncbi:hypothetical protein [Paenibacillus rigui]|uniref:DUF3995 domain-containing protein n=1 Tax=Paenibacillus rigui TaxID=554312 RepID=A0A229UNI5_9BACL|nr:hypothetical protein [Paenibacillus rigui]OXM85057.1 hypothetical protein CF651_17725 [Paenibacillus rigui]